MAEYLQFILTLELFLSSMIFIIAAYILQRLSDSKNWSSLLIVSTKNTLIVLSIISMIVSVSIYIALKPF